jgi:hypothetical protein
MPNAFALDGTGSAKGRIASLCSAPTDASIARLLSLETRGLKEAVVLTVRPANRDGMRRASAIRCETFSRLLRANAAQGAPNGGRRRPSSELREVVELGVAAIVARSAMPEHVP